MFEKLFKYPLEEYAQGLIRLRNLPPELAVLGILAVAAAAVFFYHKAPASLTSVHRVVLSVLRSLVLALVVLILCQPVLRVAAGRSEDCFVIILADNSASLKIEDAGPQGAASPKGDRKTRLAAMKEFLGPPAKAQAGRPAGRGEDLVGRLAKECPVRLFKFDRQVERISGIDQITGGGDRTNLFKPLKAVDDEFRGVPVAGVVLVTDGAYNHGGDPHDLARLMNAQDRPLWCVGLGDPDPPKDLQVIRVQAPRVVRANTNVEVYANVRCSGFTEEFDVALRRDDKVLTTHRLKPRDDVRVHRVPLSFHPAGRGSFKYTVEIPVHDDEVIRDNNTCEFLIRVADQRLPVLYLEGSPREEYRFLRRALFRDKDFRIASILRLVNVKAGERVGKDKEVRKFITQGAEPEDGLDPEDDTDNGYPKTRKELYRFEAVIFGDIPADYLSAEQLKITEEFVRKRGGGFLMLGGVNSFNRGGYHKTPIDKMLPVVLPSPDVPYQQVDLNMRITPIGLKHSILRQTDNPYFNRFAWSNVPKLIGYNPLPKTKPGAQVLATDPKTGNPLLVVQRYGSGRTAAFATGGSWHWQMALPREDELHEKFWKQLVRWLALGSKAKLTIELTKDIFAAKEAVVVRATVLDHVHQPANDARVVAVVEGPFGVKRELDMAWILSDDGVYQTQYTPIDVGDYKIEVKATLADETKTDLHAAASFSVGQTLDEFNDVSQKVEFLTELAELAGGKYYEPHQADAIVQAVRERANVLKRDQTNYEQHDIWDTPVLFAILAAALVAEWILRRRSGLM